MIYFMTSQNCSRRNSHVFIYWKQKALKICFSYSRATSVSSWFILHFIRLTIDFIAIMIVSFIQRSLSMSFSSKSTKLSLNSKSSYVLNFFPLLDSLSADFYSSELLLYICLATALSEQTTCLNVLTTCQMEVDICLNRSGSIHS